MKPVLDISGAGPDRPGTYTIEASKSGYEPYQREVEVTDRDEKVAIILVKSKPLRE